MTKIENQTQYEWAVKRVEDLLPLVKDDTPLNDPNSIELELLSNLVADYSEEHFSLGEPSLVDVLKLRMYEMGLNQKSLSQLIGVSPSRLSDYISGKCEPTLKVAREISKKLNIDASIVLGVQLRFRLKKHGGKFEKDNRLFQISHRFFEEERGRKRKR